MHTRAWFDPHCPDHKYDVMLQGDGVKIKAREDAAGLRNKREQTHLTIACSILLSMATTLAPEELKEKRKEHVADAAIRRSGSARSWLRDQRRVAPARPLPIVDPDRCALLPEHRGQKRYGEIPQLTNAKIHRHRVALGVHATPAINTPTGETSAARTGAPAVEK